MEVNREIIYNPPSKLTRISDIRRSTIMRRRETQTTLITTSKHLYLRTIIWLFISRYLLFRILIPEIWCLPEIRRFIHGLPMKHNRILYLMTRISLLFRRCLILYKKSSIHQMPTRDNKRPTRTTYDT